MSADHSHIAAPSSASNAPRSKVHELLPSRPELGISGSPQVDGPGHAQRALGVPVPGAALGDLAKLGDDWGGPREPLLPAIQVGGRGQEVASWNCCRCGRPPPGSRCRCRDSGPTAGNGPPRARCADALRSRSSGCPGARAGGRAPVRARCGWLRRGTPPGPNPAGGPGSGATPWPPTAAGPVAGAAPAKRTR